MYMLNNNNINNQALLNNVQQQKYFFLLIDECHYFIKQIWVVKRKALALTIYFILFSQSLIAFIHLIKRKNILQNSKNQIKFFKN